MKIMIVEDDARLAQMLKVAFRINKLQADYFTSGKEASKAIEEAPQNYGLVILDLSLPEVDGLKIAERLKDKKIMVPVLVLSARSGQDDIDQAIKLGVKDYFVKPFSFDELLCKVKSILGQKQ